MTLDMNPHRLSNIKRSTKPVPFKWKEQHQNLLKFIARFRYLTAKQGGRALGYADSSLHSITRQLFTDLYHGQFLDAVWQPTTRLAGSTPRIYFLSRKGKQHLRLLGIDTSNAPSSAEAAEREMPFFDHTLAINDVLINCMRAPKPLELITSQTEYELKRMLTGKKVPIADCFTVFNAGALMWEIDQGTENHQKIKEKVKAYVQFEKQGYQELFQQPTLRVCFVVNKGGIARLKSLLNWTWSALNEERAQSYDKVFLFAAFPTSEVPSEDMFSGKWYIPNQPEPVSLVRR